MTLQIVADRNIPFAEEAFGHFGEVRLMTGESIRRAELKDVDILVVRSVTKVNSELLRGTPVRFVGTATAGTDHLDIPWLEEQGIDWSEAQGSNARSVVEWVIAALMASQWGGDRPGNFSDFQGSTLGIVGHGNIGSRLATLWRQLGGDVMISDPPLQEAGAELEFSSLDEILVQANIISLHVPLTTEGPYPTHHLIGAKELDGIFGRGAILLNSARGAVVDNRALLQWVEKDKNAGALFDVFENEPRPIQELIRWCALATPHIAGYSLDGKAEGTRQIVQALAKFLDRQEDSTLEIPQPPEPVLMPLSRGEWQKQVRSAVLQAYDIYADTDRFRAGVGRDSSSWAEHFITLRRNYPYRWEFANFTIDGRNLKPKAGEVLAKLGFDVL